ncbi:VWA domain-containing protein [Haloterrigena sp. SYSU A558-1]|uniref:VWA domain-containing protein n=1 Tax=Haloterrigena gelatinilytica TaxID=2741724 RepID=A0ABX2LGM3_9EURY|nr:vWA domain-containing protein [Haloterrigena gelatinilytica]NUC74033.1 VWA domain-containing protein [Haloterrigena gelatinilytica]
MGFEKERLGAVFFAVLLATSLVAMPALASGPSASAADEQRSPFAVQPGNSPGPNDGSLGQKGGGPPGQDGPPGHDRGDANVTVPNLEENTTLETILAATERLEELDIADDDDATAAANDTVAAINASLHEYRRARYADSQAAFKHLADAQQALATLRSEVDADDEAVVDAISEELYTAGNASARLAVSDATAVVAENEGEFRNRGQRQKVESALGNAINALERADRTVSRDTSGKGKKRGKSADRSIGPDDRAKALSHLENAWKHTERAFDAVEANTEPSLSLTQGRPFERNGTVQVSLQAILTDVRPYNYDNATVTVDGNADVDPVSFTTSEKAGTTAIGSTVVDLGADPENVTVTVAATADHDADRTVEATHEIRITEDDIVWERPAPDEYQTVEAVDESSGVSVAVGGDGLHETDISVSDETPATDSAYRAGPMVRIENATPIDEATVEIPLDGEALEREGNLSIVTWDPHSDEPWTPVETEIDRDAGVATADVDHFSFFSVFRIDDWEDRTSDTITLDDEHLDDGVGNGTEIENADFVFVLDESGSMSGAPIDYAEDAAKRFVGALTDDERAGLVGYDSSASLDQSLTTDHDALNRSLERLDAGGGTHTEAGLRVGLDHLESAGWENRSDVMILLSDGKSNSDSDPLSVAEDAADAGIEISTIGLGNSIDENELREIAAITGGDFHHVEREEDLPETFERVAENQTGVDLRDTNGDGIPDLVAEMDLSMPTGEPGVVGEPLNLDPIALDTSGDGIRDNETVDIDYRVYEENNETKLTAQVTYAEHHPARIDTTGDGLTDREQLDGWEIEVVDNWEDAKALEEALHEEGDPVLEPYFTSKTASADPLVSDTTGNGLTDAEQVTLGTDPAAVDTTGDGLSDAYASESFQEDPTVFTTTPPRITALDADEETITEWRTKDVLWWTVSYPVYTYEYEFEYTIEDEAGLSRSELTKDGRSWDTNYYRGIEEVDEYTRFTSAYEGFIADSLRGAEVYIEVADVHGNEDKVRAFQKNAFYTDLAEEYATGSLSAGTTGALSGFTHGASETADLLVLVFTRPHDTYESLQEVRDALGETTVREIVEGLPESVREQQRQENPFNPYTETAKHDAFADGWYTGYSLHFAASMAYGGSVTKAARNPDELIDALRQARRSVGDLSSGLRSGSKTGLTRKAMTDGGQSTDDFLRSTGSAGSSKKASDAVEEIPESRFSELVDVHEQLGQFLTRHGDSGAEAVARLSADDVRKVLRFDRATQYKFVYVLRNKENLRLVDDSVTPQDLIRIQENGNLLETQLIAKRGDDVESVRWMELGDADAGMIHVNGRHISGQIGLDQKSITSFFPVGQTVKGRQLPATMSQNDVYELIHRATKEGQPQSGPGDTTIYRFEPESSTGVSEMRVDVEQGQIITALPEEGSGVKKWVPDLDGSGGWLDER